MVIGLCNSWLVMGQDFCNKALDLFGGEMEMLGLDS